MEESEGADPNSSSVSSVVENRRVCACACACVCVDVCVGAKGVAEKVLELVVTMRLRRMVLGEKARDVLRVDAIVMAKVVAAAIERFMLGSRMCRVMDGSTVMQLLCGMESVCDCNYDWNV